MKTRIFSLLLAAVLAVTLLPIQAGAVISTAGDWEIFSGAKNIPASQEALWEQMLCNDTFAQSWNTISDYVAPDYHAFLGNQNTHVPYQNPDYQNPTFHSAGDSQSMADILKEHTTPSATLASLAEASGVLKKLPEVAQEPIDFFYTRSVNKEGSESLYGLTTVFHFFYDFELEAAEDHFSTPQVQEGDLRSTLKKLGITFTLGNTADGYTLTVENDQRVENSVDQSYTYEKITSVSTTADNPHLDAWRGEDPGVSIGIPQLPGLGSKLAVHKILPHTLSLESTLASSSAEPHSESITNTLSTILPAHTGVHIQVDMADIQTRLPYQGAMRVKYKVLMVCMDGSYTGTDWKNPASTVYQFGSENQSAVENLSLRVDQLRNARQHRDIPKFPTWYKKEADFKNAVDYLIGGQPLAPYFGTLSATVRDAIITAGETYPLYPLDRIVPDWDALTLEVGESLRLDTIGVTALNSYDVPYYGFDVLLDGHWSVLNEHGHEAAAYAEISLDEQGMPLLKALGPQEGLQLVYVVDGGIQQTASFYSTPITLTIHGDPLPQTSLPDATEPTQPAPTPEKDNMNSDQRMLVGLVAAAVVVVLLILLDRFLIMRADSMPDEPAP